MVSQWCNKLLITGNSHLLAGQNSSINLGPTLEHIGQKRNDFIINIIILKIRLDVLVTAILVSDSL